MKAFFPFCKSLVLIFALIGRGEAAPVQKFSEYRISGAEIISAKEGPQEVEDPSTLIITLKSDVAPLEIKSDGDIDHCIENIRSIAGDKNQFIQIRVYETAKTMNGFWITQCAILDAIQPFE